MHTPRIHRTVAGSLCHRYLHRSDHWWDHPVQATLAVTAEGAATQVPDGTRSSRTLPPFDRFPDHVIGWGVAAPCCRPRPPLVVSGAGVPHHTVSAAPVQTTQIAPSILNLLGLDPQALQAVQIEHTTVLPKL
jgi:hypothetical protein